MILGHAEAGMDSGRGSPAYGARVTCGEDFYQIIQLDRQPGIASGACSLAFLLYASVTRHEEVRECMITAVKKAKKYSDFMEMLESDDKELSIDCFLVAKSGWPRGAVVLIYQRIGGSATEVGVQPQLASLAAASDPLRLLLNEDGSYDPLVRLERCELNDDDLEDSRCTELADVFCLSCTEQGSEMPGTFMCARHAHAVHKIYRKKHDYLDVMVGIRTRARKAGIHNVREEDTAEDAPNAICSVEMETFRLVVAPRLQQLTSKFEPSSWVPVASFVGCT